MTLESNPMQPRAELNKRSYYQLTGGRYNFGQYVKEVNGEVLMGYQLRYIYLIDKSCKITVPIIPFSKIDEMGAGMYKGEKISIHARKALMDDAANIPVSEGVQFDLRAQKHVENS